MNSTDCTNMPEEPQRREADRVVSDEHQFGDRFIFGATPSSDLVAGK
jgi:hypothetical protein